MNYTKPMIDLVQEIRRRVPSEHKADVKLANPDLLSELIPIYQQSTDAVLQALLKDLFNKAGEGWREKLDVGNVPDERYITKIYRGQVQLIPASTQVTEEADKKSKPKKVYRGQVIA